MRPTPFRPKIFSITMEPLKIPVNQPITSVMMGISALRKAWLYTTTRSRRPLARAVRMQSRLSASLMAARVYRVMPPREAKVMAIRGRAI